MRANSICVAGALALGLLLGAAPKLDAVQNQPPASDNTKMNKRDRNTAEPTADRAKNGVSDRDIMQKIRKAVVDDQSLSTYAHNVKIVSQDGRVTLKGPVRSQEEKRSVEEKAKEVAGAGNVTNEMSIKRSRTKH